MWTGVALTSMFPACPPGATPSSCSSRVQLWPVCDPGPEEDPGLLATSLLLIATVFLINPLLTADPLKFLGTLMKTKQPSSNKVWRKGGGDALRCGSDASKLCSPKQVLLPVTAFFPSPKSLLRGQHPVFQLWIHPSSMMKSSGLGGLDLLPALTILIPPAPPVPPSPVTDQASERGLTRAHEKTSDL